jgi:general secretion pathway protein D
VYIESSPIRADVPSRRLRGARWAVAMLAALALTLPATASAQRGGGGGGDRIPDELVEDDSLYNCGQARGPVAVNFKPEVELDQLITWAMGFTCRNFIYSGGVGGRSAKVTVIAPNRMQPAQAWRLFLVALQSMNLTVVPKGNVLEIVEAPQAKQHPIPLNLRGQSDGRDQIVRVVMRPEHLSADDLAAVLSELTSTHGEVKPIANANIVVVTDFGSHIRQMTELAAQVDRAGHGEGLYMIRVRYADANEIASKLSEILGSAGVAAQPVQDPRRRRAQQQRGRAQEVTEAAGTETIATAVPSQIVADERTNSLILLASEPAYLRVKALVERLDVQIDVEGAGRINVYRLEHADAEEMAQTLDNVISGMQQRGQAAGAGDARQRAARQRAAGDDASAPAFEGEVRVTHDAPTNSLVILASVKDFLALRDGVIRRLDVRRPQVYIEAKIVEISVDTSRDLGTSWHGGHTVGDGHILLGGAQHSDLRSVNPAGSLLSLTGLLGGIIGTPLEGAEEILFGQSIPSFGVLFQALATSSNVNLLSSPHILTLDNEEAEILVGENIPYIAGSFGTPFGGGQQQQQLGSLFPGTNIQRQDVALELKLTPQISAANEVRLTIDLEISNIASRDFEGLGPSWARRTIKDTVIVPDQQTIVIGGLMRDQITSSESKVPLLGDIPLLGYLFKYTTQTKSKTNLLVLLTPYIVNDHLDIERIVERRVREQREFMRAHSAFSHVEYRPDIDYSRKRGLLAEINRALDNVHEERERLERFEVGRVEFESGPVEYRRRDRDGEAEGDGELEAEFEVLVDGDEPDSERDGDGDSASGEGE